MTSPRNGFGRSHGASGSHRDVGTTLEKEEDKQNRPCFQAYHRGAWVEVQITKIKAEKVDVTYHAFPQLGEVPISYDHLRLRARRCDDWDCYILRRGVDVSVYTQHPDAHPPLRKKFALYDAKILQVKKLPHNDDCTCEFVISLFPLPPAGSYSPLVNRDVQLPTGKVLEDVKQDMKRNGEKFGLLQEVKIGKLSILQQPGITPLISVMESHRSKNYAHHEGRWSNDAYFLKETELRVLRPLSGNECDPRDEFGSGLPKTVRSDCKKSFHSGGDGVVLGKSAQVVLNSGPRNVGGRSEQGPAVDGLRKSSGSKYPDARMKRKVDWLDEDTSHLVQEDHSLGLSSRLTRSHGKKGVDGGTNQKGRPPKRGNAGPSRKVGNGAEAKLGPSMQNVPTDSSDEANASDSSEERVMPADRGGKSANPRFVDVDVRRGRVASPQYDPKFNKEALQKRQELRNTKEAVAKAHQERRKDELQNQSLENRNSREDSQRTPEQFRQGGSGSHGIKKAEKSSEKSSEKKGTGIKQITPQSHPSGKGAWPSQEPKLGNVDVISVEEGGKKRYRSPEQAKVTGTKGSKEAGGSKNRDDPVIKSKQSPGTHLRDAGRRLIPFTSVSAENVISLDDDESNDSDPVPEMSKKLHKRFHDEGRRSNNWPKGKPQQGGPSLATSSKGPQKDDPALNTVDPKDRQEDAHNGPPRSLPAAQKFEDPSNDLRPQLRKLRPRGRQTKSKKKADLRSQADESTKLPSTLPKGPRKEKQDPDMPVERPLYMDLLENNSRNDGDNASPAEVPVPAPAPKVEVGLSENWDPIGEEPLSDSECLVLSNSNDCALTQMQMQAWKDFDLDAATPAAVEAGPPPVLHAEESMSMSTSISNTDVEILEIQPGGEKSNILENHVCGEGTSFLKDDTGMVCRICGTISTPIHEVMPVLDWSTYRQRPEEANEWDTDFPDHARQVLEYDQTEIEKDGSMLNMFLPRHYANAMHPHQKEGFEFLWKHLAYGEGKDKKRKVDKNSGCILSHAPGTGKSFLIISFLKSYMDMFLQTRPLIVAPKIMLREWEKEFAHWKSDIKVFILNTATTSGKKLLQKHEESNVINLKNYPMTARGTVDAYRMAVLHEWRETRSVCLVSYNLFSSITDEDGLHRTPASDLVSCSLLDSPGILILDEGHFPRNKDTRIRKALMRVKTNARVLLSGTLFQNNFEELFNTLYLVRPGFVEAFENSNRQAASTVLLSDDEGNSNDNALAEDDVTGAGEKRARKRFVEDIGMKIEQGQLTKEAEVLQLGLRSLQKITAAFVNHHTGEVLSSLPGLRDFGVLLKPSGWQSKLLGWLDKRFNRPEEYLKKEIAVSETGIHPTLLERLDFLRNERHASPLPLSEPNEANRYEAGVKTKFVFDLLHSLKNSKEVEKVLIFSQHISPLLLLEGMFKAEFRWDKKREMLRLDGKMIIDERKEVIENFNDPRSPARVLLASTRACGEGITLVGASRVVFLDVLWNPAVIKQAVSRAFRLGQKKIVYVYRLIALGTVEETKYRRAIQKDWLSQAIFRPTAGELSVPQPLVGGSLSENLDETIEELKPVSDVIKELKPASNPNAYEADATCEAWEVDASNCEDSLLATLLTVDKEKSNSFFKVLEHGSAFHHRKTPFGSDARNWFLKDCDEKDLPHQAEQIGHEEAGAGFRVADQVFGEEEQVFEQFGEIVAGATVVSSETDDEEDL